MRNLILFVITFVVASACGSGIDKKSEKEFEKNITSIVTTFPKITTKSKFVYNSQNQIDLVIRKDEYSENKIKIEYNDIGLVSKISRSTDGNLIDYKTIEWFTDSLYITKTVINENKLITNTRETYFYNKNNEMVGINRYTKDSVGNWQINGSKYKFTWENGNMIKILCYVSVKHEIIDSVIVNNEMDERLFALDEMFEKEESNEFVLFYEATYKYDNYKNPYSNTSVSQMILPNEGNISKNNPISIIKNYTEGETMDFKFEYKYNDLGYPIMTDINVVTNMEGLEKANYTREFIY